MRLFRFFVYIFALIGLQSCFTGIESTPRITAQDVKKQHIVTTAEQDFLRDVEIETVGQWAPGKRFLVSDAKISLVLTADTAFNADSLVGDYLIFKEIVPSKSVMGDDIAVINFNVASTGQPVMYKTQVPYDELLARQRFDVPFTVDSDLVGVVKSRLDGQHYFITTPLWYDAAGAYAVQGLRHVEVAVIDVVAGNDVYPLRVVFQPVGSDRKFSVFMTVGSRRTATRNFDTLFAFDDPRKKYPHISDDDWALITHSRVKLGMTKDECRLALGAPATIGQRPTTAGMVEYWSYSDGIYLLFEDGLLASYRR